MNLGISDHPKPLTYTQLLKATYVLYWQRFGSFLLVASVACFLPLLQVFKVDPLVILRTE